MLFSQLSSWPRKDLESIVFGKSLQKPPLETFGRDAVFAPEWSLIPVANVVQKCSFHLVTIKKN